MIRSYEDEAARIGTRSFTRTWRVKLMVLAVFVAAMAVVTTSGVACSVTNWSRLRRG